MVPGGGDAAVFCFLQQRFASRKRAEDAAGSVQTTTLLFFQAALSLLMLRNPVLSASHHLANYHYSGKRN